MAQIANARADDADAAKAGELFTANFTPPAHNPQAAVIGIEAGLVYLPHPTDTSLILRCRLDLPERIWLAISSLLSLPPDTAEEVAEAVLHDLRAGPPMVTFLSLRDEAREWALFASRAERCWYFAAIWDKLSDDDRSRFMRRAM